MKLSDFIENVRRGWEEGITDIEKYRSILDNTNSFSLDDGVRSEPPESSLSLFDEPLEFIEIADLTDNLKVAVLTRIDTYFEHAAKKSSGAGRIGFAKKWYEISTYSAETGLKMGNKRHAMHSFGFAGTAALTVTEESKDYAERMEFGRKAYEMKSRAVDIGIEIGELDHIAYEFSFVGNAAQFVAENSRNSQERVEFGRKSYDGYMKSGEMSMKTDRKHAAHAFSFAARAKLYLASIDHKDRGQHLSDMRNAIEMSLDTINVLVSETRSHVLYHTTIYSVYGYLISGEYEKASEEARKLMELDDGKSSQPRNISRLVELMSCGDYSEAKNIFLYHKKSFNFHAVRAALSEVSIGL